ncbi:MAG: ribonuclease HII [Pseudomonadales bacterium]
MHTNSDPGSSAHCVAGVDEVGRGPLAGDVYAAAVVLDAARPIEGLNDSKKLSEKRREQLFDEIVENALAWAVSIATVEEIDELNILHASMLAMHRAVDGLNLKIDLVLVDGNRLPKWPYRAEAVVGGDAKVAEIAAASIIAKVSRDREMARLHEQYPVYGLDRHKGYPTKLHLHQLAIHGPADIHRKSFGPVKRALAISK